MKKAEEVIASSREQVIEILTGRVQSAEATSTAAVEVTPELKESLQLSDLPEKLAEKPVTYRFQSNYLVAVIEEKVAA